MNNFQTILVGIFLAFFVFGVLVFSGAIDLDFNKDKEEAQGSITIWGLFPSSSMSGATEKIISENKNLRIKYVQKDALSYQEDLVDAFAKNEAPDLFFITPDMVMENSSFIYKVSYEFFPKKDFNSLYIDGSSVYLDNNGVWAYPVLVDPMVMYYNKDMLLNNNIVYPPVTWDELFGLNSSLTKSNNLGVISESMIALGQYKNVNNAKDILATLLIQNGNNIIDYKDNSYSSLLSSNLENLNITPAESVIAFFNEFSNQSKMAYSWNSSMPNSLDSFTSSKLAFYLGKASELFNISSINPNLSFDVERIPQIKDSGVKSTVGDIYAIATNKRSSNISSALRVATILSSNKDVVKDISIRLSLPPTLRSILNDKPKDNPYLQTFFESALITKSWRDPNKIKSNNIFKEMIENVLSNNLPIKESINRAESQLNQLLKNS